MAGVPVHNLEEQPGFWLTPYAVPNQPIHVTIVVPTFSAEATLERALRSLFDQTMREIEIIVVDDASTDGSWQLICALAMEDPRLRAIRNIENCGKPVGMNRAIALARGRWLAILDADDWYHSERLSTLIAMGERWQADMVADNQFFFDAVANRIVGTAWRPTAREWALTFDGFLQGSNAYSTFNLGMLKPVIRTDFIHCAALGYDEQARHGQDFFHLLQFYLAGGKAVITDKPFYHYTQPFGTVSHQWSHLARKRYDFQTAYRINQRHAAAAAEKLTPSQAAHLAHRNNQLKSLEYYYQAKQCIANRDFIGAVRRLAEQPGLLSYAVWRLHRLVRKRIDARSIERVAIRSRRSARLIAINMAASR
jgi:succinoglycan biosynthesis protein ExoO